jgi:hypothetical protein
VGLIQIGGKQPEQAQPPLSLEDEEDADEEASEEEAVHGEEQPKKKKRNTKPVSQHRRNKL